MKKNGFTIVEMLMVIAVLAVLVGIVTTAASSAIRQSRIRRTDAMRQVIQNGISVYYQQKGEWPGSLKSLSENGKGDERVFLLSSDEAQSAIRAVVKESAGTTATPMMDVSGLFVAKNGTSEERGYGRDLKDAMHDSKKQKAIPLSSMVFGYPDAKTGHFRKYWIEYNLDSDSIEVLTNDEKKNNVDNKKYKDRN